MWIGLVCGVVCLWCGVSVQEVLDLLLSCPAGSGV